MPQTINTNLNSLNAQRNLASSQGSLAVAMQRLSSGLRVNSAKDDAAGLATPSACMRRSAAERGCPHATTASRCADRKKCARQDRHAIQRMRELSVQSANGTNNEQDRTTCRLNSPTR